MEALDCIRTRRSIRRFRQIPVDKEKMIAVIESGMFAPSAGNLQDWRFLLVTEPDLKKSLCEYSLNQPCIANAAFLVVVCSDKDQTERNYGLRGVRLYTIQNGAAAAENMLLAAHAMGLGGVWVGSFDEHKVHKLLSIPPNARAQCILAFGYPDENPDHKHMRHLNQIVYYNAYGSKYVRPHVLTRDFSVEWEKQSRGFREYFVDVYNQIVNFFDTLILKADKKGKEHAKKIKKEMSKKKHEFEKKMNKKK
jgi:nitroreductase